MPARPQTARPSRAASGPALHLTYVRLLCALLAARGVAIESALAAAGLSEIDLREGNHLVSLDRLRPLVDVTLAALGPRALGLQLGALAQTFSHGVVGYAVLSARDLGQALETVERFARLRSQVTGFRLLRSQAGLSLEVCEIADLGELRLVMIESTLVVLARLLEALAGVPLNQVIYRLPFAAPPWADQYPNYLPGKIEFGAQAPAVVLPAELIELPCITSDARAHAHACRECELALEDHGGDLVQQLRDHLIECEGEYPGLDEMAERFRLSTRTLIRRLKEQGTSYQGLLDEVRKDLAVWYLRHSALAIEEIAARQGYQDTSNFSRTFRRWFGVTPREFREHPLD